MCFVLGESHAPRISEPESTEGAGFGVGFWDPREVEPFDFLGAGSSDSESELAGDNERFASFLAGFSFSLSFFLSFSFSWDLGADSLPDFFSGSESTDPALTTRAGVDVVFLTEADSVESTDPALTTRAGVDVVFLAEADSVDVDFLAEACALMNSRSFSLA